MVGFVLLNALRCLLSLNRLAQSSSIDLMISTQLSFSVFIILLGVSGAPANHQHYAFAQNQFSVDITPISLIGREEAGLKQA